MRYTRLVSRHVLLAILLLLLATTGATAAGPQLVYGVTLDNDADIAPVSLAAQTTALASLPTRSIARVVADYGVSPDSFARSLPAVHAVADTVLELGDSSEMRGVPVEKYGEWVRSFA